MQNPISTNTMEMMKRSLFTEFVWLLALASAAIIFSKLITLITKKRKASPPLPPGPTGFPIVGCLPKMVRNKPVFRWIHRIMQEFNTEIACIRLGNAHVITVTSPELAREFLTTHDAVFASRPDVMTNRIASDGYLDIVVSPMMDQWKKMRKALVSEVLSPAMHDWLHGKRCEEADHLVRYVYNQCKSPNEGGLVNVRDAARHYCGNVIRKLILGKRFFGPGLEDGGPGFEEREHVDGLFTILAHINGFGIADYIPWLEVFDLDGCKKSVTNAIGNVKKYQDPEITRRVKMWRQGFRDTKDDILDVLINLKNSEDGPLLSIQEIKALILDMMIGMIDNPSNAAEWAIAEMINQPEIINKAYEELDRVVGKDRLVQESDLPKLNFVKACVKESFRLHPMAAFNAAHRSTKDVVVGDYFIPKDSHLLLSRLGLGRNPRVWEDPLKYKPERHIKGSEVILTDSELCVLSFSIGRRGCPGVILGSTMSAILLARLIQGFSWRPPPDSTSVSLAESKNALDLAQPLIAHVMPRLDSKVYLQLKN